MGGTSVTNGGRFERAGASTTTVAALCACALLGGSLSCVTKGTFNELQGERDALVSERDMLEMKNMGVYRQVLRGFFRAIRRIAGCRLTKHRIKTLLHRPGRPEVRREERPLTAQQEVQSRMAIAQAHPLCR